MCESETTDTLKKEETRCMVCREPFGLEETIHHGGVCKVCIDSRVSAPLFPPESSGIVTLTDRVVTPAGGRTHFFSSGWEDCIGGTGPSVLRAFDGKGDVVGIFSKSLFKAFIPCDDLRCDSDGIPILETFNLDELDGLVIEQEE